MVAGVPARRATTSEVFVTIKFEIFRGTFTSWDALLSAAAAFANSLKPDRLINICHSADQENGVVVVWYWG
jgi:hypothetical protein